MPKHHFKGNGWTPPVAITVGIIFGLSNKQRTSVSVACVCEGFVERHADGILPGVGPDPESVLYGILGSCRWTLHCHNVFLLQPHVQPGLRCQSC